MIGADGAVARLGTNANGATSIGLTHIAVSVGSQAAVDALYSRMLSDGVPVVGKPRTTGDGYYEACVWDPDGNRVEITA